MDQMAPAPATGQPTDSAGRRGRFAWALYQWARDPYFLLVNIYVFAPYFSGTVVGDPVRGQALWGYVQSVAAFFMAVSSPVIGAIADAGGRRKPWLLGTTLVALPAMAAIWFAVPGMGAGGSIAPAFLGILVALILAGLMIELSAVFHNAMLPGVAGPGGVGLLSGLGLALGNLGGIATLLFVLFAFALPETPLFGIDRAAHEHERLVGPLGALWMLVFCLPLFLFTPDARGTGLGPVAAAKTGLSTLWGTIRRLGHYRNVAGYLVARMLFGDGWVVMLFFGGIYAAGVFGWGATELTVYGVLNSVVAAFGAIVGGRVDDLIGSKRTLQASLLGCILTGLAVISVTRTEIFFMPVPEGMPGLDLPVFRTAPEQVYVGLVFLIAIFITAGIASSRTMMARIAPPTMMAEFFGLFALSGNATSFMGPLMLALVTSATGSQRLGFLTAHFFLAAGLVVLTFWVREERTEAKH